jgi:C_GCAxxG_C_C family probable redox protein
MDDMERLKALKQQGFYCSQILMLMGLEAQGKADPDLVRAMQGLAGGLGFAGETCGALTGGACLLGLYAGKGSPEEPEALQLDFMIRELLEWFKAGFGEEYGGIRCADILKGNPKNQPARCPAIVAGTFQQVKEILIANGYDLAGKLE